MLAKPATTIRTKGGGMDALEYQIANLVNHISLATGIAAPKHLDDMLTRRGQSLYRSIRKLLPTQCRMTVRLMGSHRQRGIQ